MIGWLLGRTREPLHVSERTTLSIEFWETLSRTEKYVLQLHHPGDVYKDLWFISATTLQKMIIDIQYVTRRITIVVVTASCSIWPSPHLKTNHIKTLRSPNLLHSYWNGLSRPPSPISPRRQAPVVTPHAGRSTAQPPLKAPQMWQPFGKRVVQCDGCIRKQHVVPARCREQRSTSATFKPLRRSVNWFICAGRRPYPWQGRNPCSKSHTLCYMFMQLDCFIGPIKWSCDNWA